MKVEIEIPDLPSGSLVVGKIVLMKILTPEGKVVFRETYCDDLTVMEQYGMTSSAADTCHDRAQRGSRSL